ncbi:unnamed protein product [Withania somnifera]
MEEGNTSEDILTSAAAFVEGGIQDACDDACSICLEVFSDSDPSTLPASATDSELEERIIQHLAAAMGRAPHFARREGPRGRSSAQGRPHFLVFSTHPNAPPPAGASSSTQRSAGERTPEVLVSGQSSAVVSGQPVTPPSSFQADQFPASGSGLNSAVNQLETSSSNRRTPQSSPKNQDRAGPSDFQSFSESIKSRLSAMSMRYKESLTKSSRGWKEKFFSRNSSTPDHSAESSNEVSAAVATVSTLMEHLETTHIGASSAESNISADTLPVGRAELHLPEIDDIL